MEITLKKEYSQTSKFFLFLQGWKTDPDQRKNFIRFEDLVIISSRINPKVIKVENQKAVVSFSPKTTTVTFVHFSWLAVDSTLLKSKLIISVYVKGGAVQGGEITADRQNFYQFKEQAKLKFSFQLAPRLLRGWLLIIPLTIRILFT